MKAHPTSDPLSLTQGEKPMRDFDRRLSIKREKQARQLRLSLTARGMK